MEGKRNTVHRMQLVRAPPPREGVVAEFEHGFMRTDEGRKEFLAALADPALIKAINEFESAFFPGGLGCACCQTERLTEKSTRHKNLPKEERWVLVVEPEVGYTCCACGATNDITRKSTVFCHLRMCQSCFEKI